MCEVRGAHVCGREPARPVEHPGLGVQARGGGVVRDPNLCARLLQLLQRFELRGARVRGRQKPNASPLLGMPPDGRQQRSDAGAPNERHDHVDAGRGRELRQQLLPNAGLIRGIGEQCRIQQRRPRRFDGLHGTVGEISRDLGEHVTCSDGPLRAYFALGDGCVDLIDERARQLDGGTHAVVWVDHGERALDDLGHVQRNAIPGLARPQRSSVRLQVLAKPLQLTKELFSDEGLVEAALEGHWSDGTTSASTTLGSWRPILRNQSRERAGSTALRVPVG